MSAGTGGAPGGGNRIDEGVLRALVAAGVRATSPDNSQPWKFVLHPDGLELWLDPERLGMFFDTEESASLMGCGAVLENVRLAATRHGLTARCERLADPENPYKAARVWLEPTDAPADPLAESIEARCSHRGHYNIFRTVPEASLDAIAGAADAFEGIRLHWCLEPRQRAAMRRAVMAADRVRFTCQRVHEDFHAKLRFGADADRYADGLAADTLGIEGPMLPVLRALRSWRITSALNRVGLHHVMAFRGAWVPLATAAALGTLVASSEVDYLTAGAAIERVWLAAAAEGLAFQALGALPLLLLHLNLCGKADFDDGQLRALRRAEADLARAVPGYDPKLEWPVLGFRIGFELAPPARSRRRPVDGFIVTPAGTSP